MLVRKELDLVGTEIKLDIKRELNAVTGLLITAVLAIVTLSMLLVTSFWHLRPLFPYGGQGCWFFCLP